MTHTTVIDPLKGGLVNNFSHEELEITELPEREMLLGIVNISGLGGVGAALGGLVGSILPVGVSLGGDD